MEITSPELNEGSVYLKLINGPLFMCLEPLEKVFTIPECKSYWVRASSKKPKGRNYARAVLSRDRSGYWKWKILGYKIDDCGEYLLGIATDILDKCYPDGGTHCLYFWILHT